VFNFTFSILCRETSKEATYLHPYAADTPSYVIHYVSTLLHHYIPVRRIVLEIFGIYFARAQRVLRARAPSPLEGRGGEDMQDQLYGKAINSLRVRVL